MSSVSLPRYSPPLSPAPDYSTEPACGELSLQGSPQFIRRTPRPAFVRKYGRTTIVLDGQEEGVLLPTYGRHSMVTGAILFERVDSIYEVALHIHGKLESTSTEGGPDATPLIDKKVVLWNIENDGNGAERPTQIKFTVQLPSTFHNDGEAQQLPPSYRVDFDTPPAMMVRSSYALQFSFVRNPLRKLSLFNKSKSVFIPFHYYPRTRPHRPLLHSHCFSADIKSSPEEWHQATIAVKIPKKPELAPIYFNLFVPASCIYSIRDLIPYHFQLNGPIESLQAFLHLQQDQKLKASAFRNGGSASSPETPPWINKSSYRIRIPDIISPFSTQSSTVSPSPTSSSFLLIRRRVPYLSRANGANDRQPTPRVSLLRRVTLQSKVGRGMSRSQVMGISKPRSVPPLLATGDVTGSDDDHLDWEGMLMVGKNFETGSFKAGNVNVKDYIAISIMPHDEATSPLHGLEVTVPIKLVTDSFVENTFAAFM